MEKYFALFIFLNFWMVCFRNYIWTWYSFLTDVTYAYFKTKFRMYRTCTHTKRKRNPSPRLKIQNKNVCLATAWLNSKLLHVLLFMHATCNLDVPRQEKTFSFYPLQFSNFKFAKICNQQVKGSTFFMNEKIFAFHIFNLWKFVSLCWKISFTFPRNSKKLKLT